jgi:hypothetical protein
MNYTISEASLQIRRKNILLSALFSLALIAIVSTAHMLYPKTYNDMLLWSVITLVIIGNLINYYRHRRYLRLIKDHRVEIDGDKILFHTGSEKSVLNAKDVAMLTFYRKKGKVDHIQLKLRNNRGVRLEGYGELEQMGRAIAQRIPKQQVNGMEP